MGTKYADKVYVNPKKGMKRTLPCFLEMMDALDCLKDTNFADEKCTKYFSALLACQKTLATEPKKANTLNYHLQRLSKRAMR